jgi:hypothetical protein
VAMNATDDLGQLASFDQTSEELDALKELTNILKSEK